MLLIEFKITIDIRMKIDNQIIADRIMDLIEKITIHQKIIRILITVIYLNLIPKIEQNRVMFHNRTTPTSQARPL